MIIQSSCCITRYPWNCTLTISHTIVCDCFVCSFLCNCCYRTKAFFIITNALAFFILLKYILELFSNMIRCQPIWYIYSSYLINLKFLYLIRNKPPLTEPVTYKLFCSLLRNSKWNNKVRLQFILNSVNQYHRLPTIRTETGSFRGFHHKSCTTGCTFI